MSNDRVVVLALGGNALLRRHDPLDLERERRNIGVAAAAVAPIARRRPVLITHGNGPQVGFLALEAEGAGHATPIDVLDAETEGLIGYLLEQRLRHELPGLEVVTLLTQVVVDPADPAFDRPTKPIGPLYDEATAHGLADERGWAVARDGTGWRRVVASPQPVAIVELSAIRLLLDHGAVVVAGGGGGIPVVVNERDEVRGVEAVIDKDLTAAVLAENLGATDLVFLTDVDGIYLDYGTPSAHRLETVTPTELRRHRFEAGTIGPKVEAACRFVEATGGRAAVGLLDEAEAVLEGTAGTAVGALLPTVAVAP